MNERLKLVSALGKQDDARIEQILDDQVNYGREKVLAILDRFAYGISLEQLCADGVRPVESREKVLEALEFVISTNMAVRHSFIIYHHNKIPEKPGHVHQTAPHNLCACEPIRETVVLFFHAKHVKKAPFAEELHQKAA